MTEEDAASSLQARLADLRTTFDQSFALATEIQEKSAIHLVVVGNQGSRFGFRLTELTALQRIGAVVPIPGRRRGLLGIAGIRGRVVPVFDLALLLGASVSSKYPRWLLLCVSPGGEWLALAVEKFEGLRAVPPEVIATGAAEKGRFLDGAAQLDIGSCSIIALPQLLADLEGNKETESR